MNLTTKYTKHTKGKILAKRCEFSERCERFSLSAFCGVGGAKWGEGRGEVNSFFKFVFVCFVCFVVQKSSFAENLAVLNSETFSNYVARFNAMEDENVTNFISNADSWSWLQREIPFFECPDKEVEEIYYFRWWSFRKHIEQTTNGFVITEFLTKPQPISSALGFHIAEGRWLHDQNYLDDYVSHWFHDDASRAQLHKYSQWLDDALWQRYLVTGDKKFLVSLLPGLMRDYQQWENEHLTTSGLFWQFDVRDAMEESISGSRTEKNFRPTINSYMFGNAQALVKIAELASDKKAAEEFTSKAMQLKRLTQKYLWNNDTKFFEVVRTNGNFAGVREELGFIPWMFGLPDDNKNFNSAWSQLADTKGFSAPFGITTAERCSPFFRTHGYGHCEWDGAVWPFATSQTLSALANVLRDYNQSVVTKENYFDILLTYVHSQHAKGRPYIGEYLDEATGQWIDGKNDRSRFYNHSMFADLIISGVVGLVPRAEDTVEIFPLLPENVWNYFCLDGVNYHGHKLAIFWDKEGTKYHHGQGLVVLADGKEIARGDKLQKIEGKLP
jgi:Trehalase